MTISNATIAFDSRYVYGRFGFDPMIRKWEISNITTSIFQVINLLCSAWIWTPPTEIPSRAPFGLSHLSSTGSPRMNWFSPSMAESSKSNNNTYKMPLKSAPSSAFCPSLFLSASWKMQLSCNSYYLLRSNALAPPPQLRPAFVYTTCNSRRFKWIPKQLQWAAINAPCWVLSVASEHLHI